ncbi:MAG TPA: M28 family peptidase [Clostridia bacterium]|nr:M28 family peptidase [Clostridia bacterium]
MKTTIEFFTEIAKERPVGSEANQNVLNIIQAEASQRGCDITLLPFECKSWRRGRSFIEAGSISYEIYPSPFSKSYNGSGDIAVVHTLEELMAANINEKVLFLQGEIAKNQLMPKDFPFYYPDEHKQIIDLLEEKKPKVIIAVTGKNPACGLDPFPMFEDGNFSIPSAYINESTAIEILKNNGIVKLCISSEFTNVNSSQIIAVKKSKEKSNAKIVVCAHMDTKYDTPGAIDNAAGVAVLLDTMGNLKDYDVPYDIEFVPFNSEEYYEVKGELEYLNYMESSADSVKFMINIDGPCHKESQIAVSSYNFDEELSDKLITEIKRNENVIIGAEWYSGDHSMFAYRGIPCISVTSSNLYGSDLELTHTGKDTIDQISYSLISETAAFLAGFIRSVAAD